MPIRGPANDLVGPALHGGHGREHFGILRRLYTARMDTLTDSEGNIVTADTEQIELLLGQQISGAGEQISVHLGTESIGSAPYDHLPELPGSGIHGDEDMQEEEEGGDGSGVSSGQSSGVVTQLHIGEVDEVDEVDDDEVMQAMHEHIKQEQEETTTMSINLSASGLDPNAAGVMQITPDGQVLFTPNNPDDSSPVQTQVTSLQTIRLADGTTAFLQQNTKDAANFQAVELEDGTTALVSAGSVAMPQKQAESVINAKFLEGQTVQLEDGTTAFIQAAHPKTNQSLQVQLEDGSTAYLPANLFENGQLDPNEIIQQQQQQHTEDEIQEAANSYQPKVLPSRPPSHRALALGEKAYRCTYDGCGRLYTTQHHLKIHERSHTGDKPFKCEMENCSRAFATSYGLKSHIRVHTGEKPYKCPMDECPKAFKTSGDLQKHVRTHTGEKPFKCPFEGCNQAFTTSNIRKVHIRTHTGERPFICDYKDCKKSFASATNYKNHMRIHSGEKPYVCTVLGCGKRFTEYSSLYKHHVVHTHNKPYECGHCGKTYRQTSTLAMHRRTAHNDDGTGDEQQHVTTIDVITAFDGAGMVESKDHGNENEDGDSLVINTDNGKHKTTKLTVLTSGGMTGTTTSSTMTPLTLHNSGGGTLALTDLHGQQILVVTDPAQLDMIQQLTQHANLVIQNDPATSSAPMEISKTDDASTDHCTNFLNTE